VEELGIRTDKLESKANQNSQNSSNPPSSDSPFTKPKKRRETSKRKRGAQKGHKGHKQELLEPTQEKEVLPEICDFWLFNICPGQPGALLYTSGN